MNTTVYQIVAKNNKTKEHIVTANATGWKNALDTLAGIINKKLYDGWTSHTVSTYTFPRYICKGATYANSATLFKYNKDKNHESWFLYIKKA